VNFPVSNGRQLPEMPAVRVIGNSIGHRRELERQIEVINTFGARAISEAGEPEQIALPCRISASSVANAYSRPTSVVLNWTNWPPVGRPFRLWPVPLNLPHLVCHPFFPQKTSADPLRDRVKITCTACRHLWASFARFSVVNNSKYSQVFLRYSLGRTGQISSQI